MTQGYIYFVLCMPMEAIKIGFTRNHPRKRLAGLRGGCPAPLRLMVYFEGTMEEEQRLHSAFEFLHIHGEWFRYSGKLEEMVFYLNGGVQADDPRAARAAFECAIWDVLHEGTGPSLPPESYEIYHRTGDWRPFAHLLGSVG